MSLIFVNILFFITSITLVFVAPEQYSYEFCVLTALLFVAQNLIYFIFRRDKNIVCFESLFAIAFGLTNFIYPIFYFPTSNRDFSVFNMGFNENIISYATAVAFLGYSAYLLFLSFSEIKSMIKLSTLKEKETNIPKEQINYNRLIIQIFILLIVSFAGYMLSGGYRALASEYSGGGEVLDKGISSYFYVVAFICAVLISFLIFNKSLSVRVKWFYFALLCGIILLFLTTGSRTLPLSLALCLIVSFNNNIKRISLLQFSFLLCLGTVMMTLIVLTRSETSSKIDSLQEVEIESAWDLASDLVINNRNLYTLIDHAETSGYSYGFTMLGGLLAPIPFAASTFVSQADVPVEFISSAGYSTYLDLGTGSAWGLGTNLVSDAYLAFGIFGVIFFFGILGYFVGKSKYLMDHSIYWNVCYYVFVSYAVFLVRGGFFDCFRYLVWGVVIVYVITFAKKKLKA